MHALIVDDEVEFLQLMEKRLCFAVGFQVENQRAAGVPHDDAALRPRIDGAAVAAERRVLEIAGLDAHEVRTPGA